MNPSYNSKSKKLSRLEFDGDFGWLILGEKQDNDTDHS